MRKTYVIVLYVRISVEDENSRNGIKDESNSISNQRDLLHAYLKSHTEFDGCQIIELCDDGYSGTNMNRPDMQKLIAMAKANEIDCVIVKDFSRFGRDYLTVSDYVDQIFPFLGIRFIAVNNGYDSINQNGKTSGVDVAFQNVINSYYSKDLSVKIKTGLRIKAQKGECLSSCPPFGYLKSKKKKNSLVVDRDSAPIVRRIFELVGNGMSVLQVTRLFNAEKVPTPSIIRQRQGQYRKKWRGVLGDVSEVWQDTSVIKILRDEQYLGKVVYGKCPCVEVAGRKETAPKSQWIVVENRHEPLVTAEEFEAAQANLRKWEARGGFRARTHLFTDKVFCGHCGCKLVRVVSPTPRFLCRTHLLFDNSDCSGKRMKEDVLAGIVLQAIKSFIMVLLEEKDLLKKVKSIDSRSSLRKQLAACQGSGKGFAEQKAELYDTLLEGKINRDQFNTLREQLTHQEQDMEQEIQRLETELAAVESNLAFAEQDETELIAYMKSDILTRDMVLHFIKKICIYNDQSIHIDWAFQKPVS